MPRYYFHVRDVEEVLDLNGTELVSLEAARAQAITAAGELLRDAGKKHWTGTEWRMWVTDEGGATVCLLTFSAVNGIAPIASFNCPASIGAEDSVGVSHSRQDRSGHL